VHELSGDVGVCSLLHSGQGLSQVWPEETLSWGIYHYQIEPKTALDECAVGLAAVQSSIRRSVEHGER
jgi:hypothetical protein